MSSTAMKMMGCCFMIAFLLAGCAQNSQPPPPDTLVAARVQQVPLDGADSLWERSPELRLVTSSVKSVDAPPGPAMSLKALYDGSQVAIRVEWEDPTASIHKNAWTWDGKAFSKGGEEDRLMIHFPMSNDAEFSSKGCAATCHNQEDDPEKWYMAASSEEFRYDQWHWKSTRTNPSGQADDRWLGLRADMLDTESAHYNDAMEAGGEKVNQNERRNGPQFLNVVDKDSPYIFAGQEGPVDPSQLSPGAVIPGYVLTPITGSRGDVFASGAWADGKWVVVLVRDLDTGHDDDVTFTPPKPIAFGIAVTDNGSGYDHQVYGEVLTLTWK